jgi:putative transposase
LAAAVYPKLFSSTASLSERRRLRQLEDENTRLNRLVAGLTLDKHMLSEALRKEA